MIRFMATAKKSTAELEEVREAFADWLMSDPRVPPSQGDFAKQHNIDTRTLYRWKTKDRSFIEIWERKARERNISPDRVQRVVDALHDRAINGDVKAADLYLRYIDRFVPKMEIVREDRSVEAMTDDDLAEEFTALLNTMGPLDG